EGAGVFVPVGQLPAVAGGVALLDVLAHGVQVAVNPYGSDVDALGLASMSEAGKPARVVQFADERGGEDDRYAAVDVAVGGVEQAPVLVGAYFGAVEVGVPVVLVGSEGDQ